MNNKRVRFESASETEEAMEVQLEQASQDTHEDIQKLVAGHQNTVSWVSDFYTKVEEKARAYIGNAKKKSKIILQEAKKEAETIAANSAVILQDAEKKAEAILAGGWRRPRS
jgi:hypothetical protein